MDPNGNEDNVSDIVVSLDDLVNENEKMEVEEMTMRGQASENECTYEKDYLNRQGLFACKTCQDNGAQPAAICYGCSINCHGNHELYELWSKRGYRCDCGNDKFNIAKCTLCPEKDSINVRNNYDNHNLRGLYCTCNQPYEGDAAMQVCCICEDWFHPEHVGVVFDNDSETDLICPSCSHKFMHVLMPYYPLYQASIKDVADAIKRPSANMLTIMQGDCLLPKLAASLIEISVNDEPGKEIEKQLKGLFSGEKATVWMPDWREKLCTCSRCQYLYELEGLSFLTDKKDTIEWYLDNAKKPEDDIHDMLQSLERPMQIEVLTLMRDFREQLLQFFQSCSDSGKVVTEKDVLEFFANLRSQMENRPTLPDRCNQPHQ